MKICFVENYSEANPEGLIKGLIDLGHEVTPYMTNDVDAIFNASVVKMDVAIHYKLRYGHIPLVNYCWDYYKWAHEGKHSFNWPRYVEMLRMSDLIMVPSASQQLRLKELLDLNSVVVKTSIDVYDHEVTDERFVLDPVRYYPEENKTWVEEACRQLGIKCIHSEHQFSLEQFRKLVNSCTFMTCAYREASTGGLSLMEGLWNGKPSLVSNSPYMGASDYLGEFGTYFQYDSFEDLKSKIKEMFDNPPQINVQLSRQYISQNFSAEAMAKAVEKHLCALNKN